MKKILIILIVLLCVGCSDSDEIKIGFVVTLTNSEGISSEYGIASRNGFELAISNINKAGGIKGKQLIPVYRDDQDDLDLAKQIIDDFAQEGIQYVYGFSTSKMYPAIEYAHEKYNMIFITGTMSSANFEAVDDNLLRLVPSDYYHVNSLSDLASKKLDLKRLAIVYDPTNRIYTIPFKDQFQENVEMNGSRVVYVSESNNIDKLIDELLLIKPDGILLINSSKDVVAITQQLKKHHIDSKVFIAGWATTPDLFTLGGKTVEGLYCSKLIDENSKTTEYIAFSDTYTNQYNSPPSTPSLMAYESMFVLYEGMLNADKLTANSVKESIIEIEEFMGLQYAFSIDSYGDANRALLLMQIKNQLYRRIE